MDALNQLITVLEKQNTLGLENANPLVQAIVTYGGIDIPTVKFSNEGYVMPESDLATYLKWAKPLRVKPFAVERTLNVPGTTKLRRDNLRYLTNNLGTFSKPVEDDLIWYQDTGSYPHVKEFGGNDEADMLKFGEELIEALKHLNVGYHLASAKIHWPNQLDWDSYKGSTNEGSFVGITAEYNGDLWQIKAPDYMIPEQHKTDFTQLLDKLVQ